MLGRKPPLAQPKPAHTMSPILRHKWPSQICRGDKLLPALSCRFCSSSKLITLLQTKPLLTAIPRAKTFSMIYSATVQMLPVFWIPRNLASPGSTPVGLQQGCPLQRQPHQSTTLRGSTHPRESKTNLLFHTGTQVPRAQDDPRITAFAQPHISTLCACQHDLVSRKETEAHSSHHSASGDAETQAASESVFVGKPPQIPQGCQLFPPAATALTSSPLQPSRLHSPIDSLTSPFPFSTHLLFRQSLRLFLPLFEQPSYLVPL